MVRTPRPSLSKRLPVTLEVSPVAFFNQLFHYSSVDLVVRAGGCVLYRKTSFGIFQHVPTTPPMLHDPVSSLLLSPDAVRRICYLEGGAAPPCFEIEWQDTGFSLALYPACQPEDCKVSEHLLNTLPGREESLPELRSCGADRWLDESLEANGPGWNHWHVRFTKDGLQDERLGIHLRSHSLSTRCEMVLANLDYDAPAWRFSDSRADTVLLLDVHHPSLRKFPAPAPLQRFTRQHPECPRRDLALR